MNQLEDSLPKVLGDYQKEMIIGESDSINTLKSDIKNLIGTEVDVLILERTEQGRS